MIKKEQSSEEDKGDNAEKEPDGYKPQTQQEMERLIDSTTPHSGQ